MIIRKMTEADRATVTAMMTGFYASPAVHTNGSSEIFSADIDACVGDSPYLEGYVFESDGKLAGYGMVAKSFSTEFGCPCIWIEDLYFDPEYRGRGFGRLFFDFLDKTYSNVVFRLEVEEENERAVALYQKSGFDFMPYLEMKKDN